MSNYTPESSYQNMPNSTMALLSLIAGILGLTLLPIIGGIAAVILGYLAARKSVRVQELWAEMAWLPLDWFWVGSVLV